ncbi:unnamed protein product, partial [marine sediment metagenome]
IEALKALKEKRIAALPWTEELLPGETEIEDKERR